MKPRNLPNGTELCDPQDRPPRKARAWARCRALAGLLGIGLATSASGAELINPPLGAYVNLRPEHFAESVSYAEGDRLVLTPYFYWYDSRTGAHLFNPDGTDALTDHPVRADDFTYRSADWHTRELSDMEDAGIQVALPVYWGEPSQRLRNQPVSAQPWSYAGLPPLVAARERLLQEGRDPPRAGMFYDTSTLQYNSAGVRIDLTTAYGRQWFYESVRDFFSLIPPKHWAMIDGRPIVFLYSASFALDYDQACLDYLAQAFASDFGGREPYVVREISWQVTTAQVYAWGGALGLKNPGVASLGPGYDHSAVPGREPLVIDREGGAFFERNWLRFLRRPSPLVMIETWNEFHEGTDIAASVEYGRAYIEMNRRFADMFHQGVVPPMPRGPFSDVKLVRVELGNTNVHEGLLQVESADGLTEPAMAGGQPCRAAVASAHAGRYVYFRVDDSFKWADSMRVDVLVDYYDTAGGSFTLEFDGSDLTAPFQGAYTPTGRRVPFRGTRQWKQAQFSLSGARFLNSQNSGSDFRLVLDTDTFYVRQVEVIRFGVPDEAGSTRPGFQQNFADPPDGWTLLGSESGEIQSRNGRVTLEPSRRAGARLLVTNDTSHDLAQNILARVRLSRSLLQDRPSGGVVVAADPASGVGITFTFSLRSDRGPVVVLSHEATGASETAAGVWTANQWIWLRLIHRPNRTVGEPDLFARVWPADGETAEPASWQVTMDYYPANSARPGRSGLVGSSENARTAVECDYFLVQAAALPQIAVRLPALKAAKATLTPSAGSGEGHFELQLLGSPTQTYFIQSSSNLVEWTSVPVTTDPSGWALFQDTATIARPFTLYRAATFD